MSLPPLLTALNNLTPPIAIACSGGLDSIALLHAMYKMANINNAYTLPVIALHINHNIHPDSNHWQSHVYAFANQLGTRFDSLTIEGLSNNMPNLENAARDARYHALEQLCEQHSIATLLFAHHANDQAETILLNLCRGTGLNGIGMPPIRQVKHTTWVRPWLSFTRKDIEIYATQHHLKWIDDPSNTDETLRRNAMRHTVLPILKHVEPRTISSLLRFAQLAQDYANTEYQLAFMGLKPYILQHIPCNTIHTTQNSNMGNEQGIDWRSMSKGLDIKVQASLLRTWLMYLHCKPASKARLYAMIKQINAQTGNGVRCYHDGWKFEYRNGKLWGVFINVLSN